MSVRQHVTCVLPVSFSLYYFTQNIVRINFFNYIGPSHSNGIISSSFVAAYLPTRLPEHVNGSNHAASEPLPSELIRLPLIGWDCWHFYSIIYLSSETHWKSWTLPNTNIQDENLLVPFLLRCMNELEMPHTGPITSFHLYILTDIFNKEPLEAFYLEADLGVTRIIQDFWILRRRIIFHTCLSVFLLNSQNTLDIFLDHINLVFNLIMKIQLCSLQNPEVEIWSKTKTPPPAPQAFAWPFKDTSSTWFSTHLICSHA